MIEVLEGTHEIVRFNDGMLFKLYDNSKAENYPMHCHLPIELIMPIANGYTVYCKNACYDLHEEDILLVQPGILHACQSPQTGRRLICQIALPSQLISVKMNTAMSSRLPPVMHITPKLDSQLHSQAVSLLYNAYNIDTGSSCFSDFSQQLYAMQLILLIYSYFEKNSSTHEPKHTPQTDLFTRLQQTANYMMQHYAETLTLEDMARKAGFSKYHFSRLFKTHTGESFYRYLNTIRMSNAQNMLKDYDVPITDIAYATGYASMSSFIRMFKDFFDCTPSSYRRMLRQG